MNGGKNDKIGCCEMKGFLVSFSLWADSWPWKFVTCLKRSQQTQSQHPGCSTLRAENSETAGQGSAVPEHLSAKAPFLTFLFPLLWGQYKATFSTAFLLAFPLCISTCNLLITRSVWQKQNHVYRFLNFPWPPRASPIPTAPARQEDARLDKVCWDPPTASFSSNSVIIELAKRQFITRI